MVLVHQLEDISISNANQNVPLNPINVSYPIPDKTTFSKTLLTQSWAKEYLTLNLSRIILPNTKPNNIDNIIHDPKILPT